MILYEPIILNAKDPPMSPKRITFAMQKGAL